MNGSHYEELLAAGVAFKDVLALACDAAEVQAILVKGETSAETEEEAPATAPTIFAPRGIAIVPDSIESKRNRFMFRQ